MRGLLERWRRSLTCYLHGHDWDAWAGGLIPLNPRYDQRPFRFRFCKRCRKLERDYGEAQL